MEPGADYHESIERTIDASDAVVVIIGPRWLECTGPSGALRLDDPEDLVRREVAVALGRPEMATIPVLIQGAGMPSHEALPEPLKALARRNGLEISDSRFDYDAGRLVGARRRVLQPAVKQSPATRAQAPSRRSRWLVAAAATAVTAVLAFAYVALLPDSVAVPNVVGQESAFAAAAKLSAAELGFESRPKTRVDDRVVPGTVVGQLPAAGSDVDKGPKVTIVLAVGSGNVRVPRVFGLKIARADNVLRAKGLTLGQASPQPFDPQAKIPSQIPAEGEVVKTGTRVNVFYPDAH